MYLQATYNAQPAAWNPHGLAIVRIIVQEPLSENAKTRSSLHAFARRLNFTLGGSTSPTTRLFCSTIDNLGYAAQALDTKPLARNGQFLVDRYFGLQYTADMGREVGRERGDLLICYHNVDQIEVWPGIEAMVIALGGTDARRWNEFDNTNYVSVQIDHTKAVEIAKHPLVRRVEVAPQICYR